FKEEKVGNIRVVAHPEVLNGAKEVIKRYQKAWSFMEEWLGVPMSPSVIYILSDNYYYQINDSINHDFFVMRNEYKDDFEIANELLYELIWEDTFNIYNRDFHILSDAMTWAIMNHLHKQVSFIDWYKSNYWVQDDDLILANLLQAYEDKGHDQFKDLVKYLFDYWKGHENKQNFDMKEALKQYEGESKQ